MRILYGINSYYKDVTEIVFMNLLINNIIEIPKNDLIRASLFKDHLPGIKKHIKIIDILDTFDELIIFDDEDYQLDLGNLLSIGESDNIIDIANQCYTEKGIYPISFSHHNIDKILYFYKDKSKNQGHVIPGDNSTYIFTTEEDYYNDYRISLFGLTKLKGGWDCNRHVEILYNSCLPLFENVNNIPKYTMIHYPKHLLNEINNKYQILINDEHLYNSYIYKISSWFDQYLTNESMIDYILNVTNNKNINNVLFIDEGLPNHPDYQSVMTLNGLKLTFKKKCEVMYPVDYIYDNTNVDVNSLYGLGISYTNIIKQNHKTDHELEPNYSNIFINIVNHNYDLIVYGSISLCDKYLEMISEFYESSKIIGIIGEDIGVNNDNSILKYKNLVTLFVREIY